MSEEQLVDPSFGSELRQRRIAAGMTLTELSKLTSYSKSHISKVEHAQKSPSSDFARRADVALEAHGALARRAAWSSGTSSRSHGLPGQLAARGQTEDAAYSAIEARLSAAGAPESGSVRVGIFAGALVDSLSDQQSLDYYETLFTNIRGLGQTLGPSTILPIVLAQIPPLEQFSQNVAAEWRNAVLVLLARFVEYAGWMAQEKGNEDLALALTNQAAQIAGLAGDHDLVAYTSVRRALLALYHEDAHGTIAHASAVRHMECSPQIKRIAAQREAQGHALANDYEAFRKAIDEAAAFQTEERRNPPLVRHGSTNIPDTLALAEGWALHDLGRWEEAAKILSREFEKVKPESVRAKARIGARLALTLGCMRSFGPMSEVLTTILVPLPNIESATIRADLRSLSRVLGRWRTEETVQRIMPALSAALMPGGAPIPTALYRPE